MPLINFEAISSNLKLTDKIWTSIDKSDVSYPEEANDLLFQYEENSFWFVHRNNCILENMKQFQPEGFLLDVGGGNGYVTRALKENGIRTVLLESGQRGINNAVKRGVSENIIHSTLEDAGFYQNTIPAIGIFDVLEHNRDAGSFLKKILQILKPGGRLYITVPAHKILWSDEDEYASHFNRYNLKKLTALLNNSGFHVEYATYFFWFLVIPIFFFRALPSKFRSGKKFDEIKRIKSVHHKRTGISGRLLNKLFVMERNRIKKQKRIPFGSSCLVVAKKPENNQE